MSEQKGGVYIYTEAEILATATKMAVTAEKSRRKPKRSCASYGPSQKGPARGHEVVAHAKL